MYTRRILPLHQVYYFGFESLPSQSIGPRQPNVKISSGFPFEWESQRAFNFSMKQDILHIYRMMPRISGPSGMERRLWGRSNQLLLRALCSGHGCTQHCELLFLTSFDILEWCFVPCGIWGRIISLSFEEWGKSLTSSECPLANIHTPTQNSGPQGSLWVYVGTGPSGLVQSQK